MVEYLVQTLFLVFKVPDFQDLILLFSYKERTLVVMSISARGGESLYCFFNCF